jgi:deazaflavin-dependent oxidoreductase (nitroreductase family)
MPEGIPDNESIKAFNQSIADEFRANNGKVGGQFEGGDLLLLTTTGAKSGQPRLSPLAYFRVDGKLLIIGSFAGADVDPGWVHNLRANPSAHIEVGAESSDVTARELPSGERDDLFGRIAAASPGFAGYQAKTSRVIPVFELQPTS